MFRKFKSLLIIVSLATYFSSCSGGEMPAKNTQFPTFKDVPTSSWKNLSQKKIFFGHQSVGENIMDGVNDLLKENPQIQLTVIQTRNLSEFSRPLLAHDSIGKNENPSSKIEDFVRLIEDGLGDNADIAFFKFCFVDIDSKTDVHKVFATYKNMMSRLKQRYPDTTFVHVTVPLIRGIKSGPKTWIKQILGMDMGFFDNIHNAARNDFNSLIIETYGGNDRVFDLAAIESTYTDGSRASFSRNGKIYYSLVPDYTHDGGHLNAIGRKIVAEQLLIFLANLVQ